MPRRDRTGPEGMGPMTGRRMGPCAGYDAPSIGFGFGRGARRGFGRGRAAGRRWSQGPGAGWGYGPGAGWGHGPGADWDYGPGAGPADPAESRGQEMSWLKSQAAGLEEALERINERLQSLEE